MKKKLLSFDAQNILSRMARPFVENMTGISRINQLYASLTQENTNATAFSEEILQKLGVSYTLPSEEALQELREIKGPLVFVSNNPLGGVEILLMIVLMQKIREDYRLVGNDMLAEIEELEKAIISIEKTHHQAEKTSWGLQLISYLQEGGMLALFPNGENNETHIPGMAFQRQDWDERLARIFLLTKATIVPIYFHGKSSFVFQFMGLISPNFRKKLLPWEFLNNSYKKIAFRLGKKIPISRLEQFDGQDKYEAINRYLQAKIYLLSLHFLTDTEMNITKIQNTLLAFWGNEADAKPIIAPIPTVTLQAELQALPQNALLVDTEKMQIWVFKQKDAPNIMQEIGRLREITFREIGEGSGKACDTDVFDTYYYQLLLWDKQKKQVAGGYRMGKTDEILQKYGFEGIYICTVFKVKEELLRHIQPALELGRSFIVKEYQRSYQPLLLLWTGICQFIVQNPKYHYIMGPVSISGEMNAISKTLLINFLEDNQLAEGLAEWVKPKHKFRKKRAAAEYYHSFSTNDMRDLNDAIVELEKNNMGVPVLFKHYLKMGAKMLAFNVDPDFSDVLDCFMMTDLLKTDKFLLQKYMGKENLAAYYAFHG